MAKNDINLSELTLPSMTLEPKSQTGQDITSGVDDLEINRVKTDYNLQMNERKRELIKKVQDLEGKLRKHELKEGMLDKIISTTYVEMDNLGDKEFTRRGQKQTVLIKQLEALSILHDTLLKYEDMIQKYHKILMDIENNKLNSYLKVAGLKKDEEKADEGIGAVLLELQGILKGETNVTGNPLMDEIKQELADGDY